MSRADWTAPAPLEVERPRLPWWVMLPRKVLLVGLPVIAAWTVFHVVNFVARRIWRYPVLVLGSAALLVLGLAHGGAWVLLALTVLGAAGGLWRWRHRASFERTAARQLRSEIRRAWVYARVWRRTLRFAELTKKAGATVYYPRIRRVRAEGWRDRVLVGLLHGQAPDAFTKRAEELAHAFGATACRVRVERPRRIWLDFIHTDTLATPIPPPALPADGAAVDLRRLVVGRSETGRPWQVRLLGNHLLVVGSTGAGKSSVMWSLLWALTPAIRVGAVQVFGIDPKGGMELGRAPALFSRLVCDNGPEAVELLEHVATLTRHRATHLRSTRAAAWSPETGSPFVLLIVDELADLVAYQTDRGLKTRANAAIQTIASQGRAPGVAVLGQVQDPRKAVIDFRHLFPTKIALRLDEPDQVDLALGDGARDRGAAAHLISEDTPGVAWICTDGRRGVDRVRAFRITDTDLDTLTRYLDDGPAVTSLPRPTVAEPAATTPVKEAA